MIIMIFFLQMVLSSNILLSMDNKQEISPKEFDRHQANLATDQPTAEPKKFVTHSEQTNHTAARKLIRQQLWRSFKNSFCCCCARGYYDDSDL